MSWIDKKYKNHFTEQQYPEGMKQKGWDSMQSLLDKQMPVSTPKGGSAISNPWYLLGAAAVIITIVGIPFFIANQPKDPSPALDKPGTIQVSPSEEISVEPNSKDVYPSDFKAEENISTEKVVVQVDESKNQQRNNQASENEAQIVAAKPTNALIPEVSGKATESPVVEAGNQVTETKPSQVETAVAMEQPEVLIEEVEESSQVEEMQITEVIVPELLSNEVSEPLVQEEPVFAIEEPLVETQDEKIEAELEKPSEEVTDIVVLEDVYTENTETTEVDEKEILANAETSTEEPANVEGVEEAENVLASSENVNTAKAAHLAFLDADEQAPMPNLLTFSKERFALSVWGGYLFTGKVISGGNEIDRELREKAESPIYTVPTGVALDYFVDKNWTVGVGLGWAEYGEDVDYTLYNVTSTIDTVAIDGRYDSPSNYPNIVSIDSTRVIDTVNQGHWNYQLSYRNDDSTENKYAGKNSFRYIEVPLTVGYRFGSGRVKPWVKAGVIVGLPVEASYRYPQFETSSYSEGGSKASLAAIQYSGLLQIGADFYINRALSVRLNALGSYQINAMLTNEGVRQRYYRVGASIGVAYNF